MRQRDVAAPEEVCETGMMSEANLLERLGGLERVSLLVMTLYDRVLASERLEPFFANVDMRRLMEHQANFLASIMGGPESYTNEELRQAHARLGIDQPTFREMIAQFRSVLEDQQMAATDVEFVIGELEKRERYIVTKPDAGTRVA
jgi:hemoglobin